MKKLLFILVTILFFCACACRKKTVTPNYSALIAGKWVCNSYQKDGDTLVNRKPYSISFRYEAGWQFLIDKQVQYRNGSGSWLSFGKDNYSLEGKMLTLNQDDGNSSFSTSNFRIIELSNGKLTVYGEDWKSTFFLTKEQ